MATPVRAASTISLKRTNRRSPLRPDEIISRRISGHLSHRSMARCHWLTVRPLRRRGSGPSGFPRLTRHRGVYWRDCSCVMLIDLHICDSCKPEAFCRRAENVAGSPCFPALEYPIPCLLEQLTPRLSSLLTLFYLHSLFSLPFDRHPHLALS